MHPYEQAKDASLPYPTSGNAMRATQATQPRETPEIMEQADRLSRAADNLGMALNSLRDRTQAIVRPMPATPPGKESLRALEAAMSPLGDGLRSTALRLEQIAYELAEFTGSLAV